MPLFPFFTLQRSYLDGNQVSSEPATSGNFFKKYRCPLTVYQAHNSGMQRDLLISFTICPNP
jgi:hypothetical protein